MDHNLWYYLPNWADQLSDTVSGGHGVTSALYREPAELESANSAPSITYIYSQKKWETLLKSTHNISMPEELHHGVPPIWACMRQGITGDVNNC